MNSLYVTYSNNQIKASFIIECNNCQGSFIQGLTDPQTSLNFHYWIEALLNSAGRTTIENICRQHITDSLTDVPVCGKKSEITEEAICPAIKHRSLNGTLSHSVVCSSLKAGSDFRYFSQVSGE